jgi:hypothetical protein
MTNRRLRADSVVTVKSSQGNRRLHLELRISGRQLKLLAPCVFIYGLSLSREPNIGEVRPAAKSQARTQTKDLQAARRFNP